MEASGKVRIAAVGDIHCTRGSQGQLKKLFIQMNENADILVLCGDLTDYGLPEEAHLLAEELKDSISIPVLAVLGNHDYHSGKADEVKRILTDSGVILMDGDVCEVQGIGFAGVKGFIGGFGRGLLQPWGEESIKHFVREAVEETLKLESALARLKTPRRIAILHYAPIAETVLGEPAEILPFMGCSRLEEPINRFKVDAVFHGHAHHGKHEGRTSAGVPVYNVAMALLAREFSDRPAFRLLEIEKGEEVPHVRHA